MFVLFTVNYVFLLYFILSDQNLFYFLKKLSLNLSHTLFNGATRASEFFAAFFRELFCINVEDSQARDGCNIFMFSSVFSINDNIFFFNSFFFFFLFGGFLFFGLFDFLFDSCDIFFFEIRMILGNFSWGEFIKNFYAKIWIFTIFAEFEGEAACWDYEDVYLDNKRLF